ncbi:hypothetical protein MAL04_20565 (plasmid) [Leptospira noguchii]|nr:hypothetical protein MAL04_20565 [Leptospira noguchii]
MQDRSQEPPSNELLSRRAGPQQDDGRQMYVDATWDGLVPCIYFDAETRSLVKWKFRLRTWRKSKRR